MHLSNGQEFRNRHWNLLSDPLPIIQNELLLGNPRRHSIIPSYGEVLLLQLVQGFGLEITTDFFYMDSHTLSTFHLRLQSI